MKKILIIHPVGNAPNNPNLSAIVELLNKHYAVDLLQRSYPEIYQKIEGQNIRLLFYESGDDYSIPDDLFSSLCGYEYDFIFGVDTGIVVASAISARTGTPYAFISYEIFFKDEYDVKLKAVEIESCKNISFAICQDSLRSYCLSNENEIPLEKILNIPVAGYYRGPYKKSNDLREKFNIPPNKKIALYIGSIGTWAKTDVLLEQIKFWPDDWVLVLHSRYGLDDTLKPFESILASNHRIYLSSEPVERVEQLEKMVSSADIGVALYNYEPHSHFTGKNILFLGMSSGKTGVYFKYGIPVLINHAIMISEVIAKNKLGVVAWKDHDINPKIIDEGSLVGLGENALRFYKEKLDFKIYEEALLSILSKSMNGLSIEDTIEITNANNSIEFTNFNYVFLLEEVIHKHAVVLKECPTIVRRIFRRFNRLLSLIRKSTT